MSITLNTYGIRSVNTASFNATGTRDVNGNLTESIPVLIRDLVNTILRINNLTLNILGYIPVIQQISGCVRMGIGGSIVLLTLALGSPTETSGIIVGRWYDEALLTAIAQVSRGVLEAFVPFGSLINLSLDAVGTIYNLKTELSHLSYSCGMDAHEIIEVQAERRRTPPYADPSYPIPLLFLYFA